MTGATRISKSFSRPGRLDVEYRGLEESLRRDLYFKLIGMRWPGFMAVLITGYFGTNLLFALAYWWVGPAGFDGMRSESPWLQFEDAFFFSVQTLATIGYGRISPVALLPNILVTIEALLGLFGLAVMTGLLFARFAKPTARVVFSRNVLITEMDGTPSLVFRVANMRKNQIVEAKITVSALMNVVTKEGETYRDWFPLELERSSTPTFALSWTVVHPIDANSPLHGLTAADLAEREVLLIVVLAGTDSTLAQEVHARIAYAPDEVIFGRRFQDMFSRSEMDGRMVIDFSKLHELR